MCCKLERFMLATKYFWVSNTNYACKELYFRDNEGNLLEAAWSIWDPKDDIKEDYRKEKI